MRSLSMIPVTQPDLPPLDALLPSLSSLWQSKQLTNGGAFHQQLELKLAEYLRVPAMSLYANGTLALLAAIKALGLRGEVITTPYTFVATVHAIAWSGLTPVFVDIEDNGFNLDPALVEAAINPNTCAVLPVHVYGYPCDSAALRSIAAQHGLKLLYDAAHAFGVQTRAGNLLLEGDLSALSFHATKVFHTVEGGAVICPDADMKRRLDRLKNFGFADELTVDAVGINAKMNELQAAFGCAQLPLFEAANLKRQAIDAKYRRALCDIEGLVVPELPAVQTHNHGYFPIRVLPSFGLSRDELVANMRARGVMVRRYFYPLVSQFAMYVQLPSASEKNLPRASKLAREIVCLPMFAGLSAVDSDRVIEALHDAKRGGRPASRPGGGHA